MPLPPAEAGACVIPRPALLACDVCDALYRHVPLGPAQQARCVRCGQLLGRGHRLDRPALAALSLAALVTFAIANLQPIVQLDLRGAHTAATLPVALWDTWRSGEHLVALLAGAVALVFPLAVILLRLYALSPLLLGRLPPAWREAMRALVFASRWSMVEVLMLSALVAVVRIAAMATARPDVGLYAFGALVLLLTALESAGLQRLWAWAPPRAQAPGTAAASSGGTPEPADRSAPPVPRDARRLGLHGCHACRLVSEVRGPLEGARCPRCAAPLHRHAALGLQRSWAWLAAAAVLYVPANALPVMATADVLHGHERHTILGGILELWKADEWALALIVFVASIVVPLLKMGALSLLAFSAQRGWRGARPERTRLYRLVEAVGHWSMLDVLVVVLLVAMVRFGALATVQPGPGLLAFGAVVVLTMLASEAYDPRLIWNRRPDDEH